MSKRTYSDQTIADYLLGSLPPADVEDFDELSFTDNEFAGALKVVEKDLIDAYVQGELSGPALEQFKSHYLASPLRREQVRFAEAFQLIAERSANTQAVDLKTDAAPKRRGLSPSSILRLFIAPRWAGQWGFAAAALALLVVVSLLLFQNLRLREEVSQSQARRQELLQRQQVLQKEIEANQSANSQNKDELARLRDEREQLEQKLKKVTQDLGRPASPGDGSVVSFILAPPLRGVGESRRLSIPPGASLVAVRLQLEAADYRGYRVALIDPGNSQTLWRSGNLKAGAMGEGNAIKISLPAGLLKPKNYAFRVSGIMAGGGSEIVGDYPFKAVR